MPGRVVVERVPNGSEHRTGIWTSNQKQRRAELDQAQLAALGVNWARA
ncbi:hypothetical protein ACFV4Q_24420 [Streptomyces nojiriensis]